MHKSRARIFKVGRKKAKAETRATFFHTKCPKSVYKTEAKSPEKGEVMRLMTQNSGAELKVLQKN